MNNLVSPYFIYQNKLWLPPKEVLCAARMEGLSGLIHLRLEVHIPEFLYSG
jgi:hypothetical protein